MMMMMMICIILSSIEDLQNSNIAKYEEILIFLQGLKGRSGSKIPEPSHSARFEGRSGLEDRSEASQNLTERRRGKSKSRSSVEASDSDLSAIKVTRDVLNQRLEAK